MENGKWFFIYTIRVSGVNGIGEGIDDDIKIRIRLYPLDKKDAERQARIIWREISLKNVPHEFRSMIKEGDDIEFSDPTVLYEGERFEFKLN